MFTGVATIGILAGSLASLFHLDEQAAGEEEADPTGDQTFHDEVASLRVQLREVDLHFAQLADRAPRATRHHLRLGSGRHRMATPLQSAVLELEDRQGIHEEKRGEQQEPIRHCLPLVIRDERLRPRHKCDHTLSKEEKEDHRRPHDRAQAGQRMFAPKGAS